jgi:hypothetical protein
MNTTSFYKDLPSYLVSTADIFVDTSFVTVPDDWEIIVADVKDSSKAVSDGRHNDVNLVAGGSVIAVLNVAHKNGIEIPFFYGGDGGTFIVPPVLLKPALAALTAHIANTNKNFNLDMHKGHINVGAIYEKGHFLKITKLNTGEGLHKAIIFGDGLIEAEKIIKAKAEQISEIKTDSLANMEGLECRWNSIKPPASATEVVCLLIIAVEPLQQRIVFKDVLQQMQMIYGDINNRHPLSAERLRLLFTLDKINKEMIVKYGKWKSLYFFKSFFQTIAGLFYFKFNLKIKNLRGRIYLEQLISNSDTLMIDGRINTIISGTEAQRHQLITFLLEKEKEGSIIFGHHVSSESIMTCYIRNRNKDHIHFVDGSNGGYTKAAIEIKRKLQITKEIKEET